jgi:hypothetical protein
LAFLRVVEVFPPILPDAAGGQYSRPEDSTEAFVRDVKKIRGVADVLLVASLKKPGPPRLSTVETAILLHKKLGLDAAPVLVVRGLDRLQLLSSVVAGLVSGLKSMMLAWGDADGPRRPPRPIGFSGLGEALAEATKVRERSKSSCRFFAPVDLRRLFTSGGVTLAKERLVLGASLLLAQPPTTDATETFDSHAKLIAKAGLGGRVLPSVFPFRDARDVLECERYFGWKLPKTLHEAAREGESSLQAVQRDVVRRLRSDRFPGVYVSTRGNPYLAKLLLS